MEGDSESQVFYLGEFAWVVVNNSMVPFVCLGGKRYYQTLLVFLTVQFLKGTDQNKNSLPESHNALGDLVSIMKRI